MNNYEVIRCLKLVCNVYKEDSNIHIALCQAIQALQEKAERENPQPLTLEELKGMAGEPIYIIHTDEDFKYLDGWGIASVYRSWEDIIVIGKEYFKGGMCGKSWFAYKYRPYLIGEANNMVKEEN